MHQRLRHRAHGQEGFTLIELLVVILIIGILAAVAIPTFLSQTGKAKDANVQSNLNTIQTAESTYNTTANAYTTSLTTLGSTEPTIKSFSTANTAIVTTNPGSVTITDPNGGSNSGSNVNYIAAMSSAALGSSGAPASSAVTYYLASYADGGVANVCYVPANINAGACNAPSAGSSAATGTWGNGNS